MEKYKKLKKSQLKDIKKQEAKSIQDYVLLLEEFKRQTSKEKAEEIIQSLKEELKEQELKEKDLKEQKIKEKEKQESTRVQDYIDLIKEFKIQPSREKAEVIISELQELKFKDLDYYKSQDKIIPYHDAFCLWLYEHQDIDLFERYLLAKVGYDKTHLKEIDKEVDRYLEHLKRDGYIDTEQGSIHTKSAISVLYHEDQLYFLTLLGIRDFMERPADKKDSYYFSEKSKKLILRMVVGAYGPCYSYVYFDKEFAHDDYEKKVFEKIHKGAYKCEMEKSHEKKSKKQDDGRDG